MKQEAAAVEARLGMPRPQRFPFDCKNTQIADFASTLGLSSRAMDCA
jgi:hypothetical protein